MYVDLNRYEWILTNMDLLTKSLDFFVWSAFFFVPVKIKTNWNMIGQKYDWMILPFYVLIFSFVTKLGFYHFKVTTFVSTNSIPVSPSSSTNLEWLACLTDFLFVLERSLKKIFLQNRKKIRIDRWQRMFKWNRQ